MIASDWLNVTVHLAVDRYAATLIAFQIIMTQIFPKEMSRLLSALTYNRAYYSVFQLVPAMKACNVP